jgi:hypothetical protein
MSSRMLFILGILLLSYSGDELTAQPKFEFIKKETREASIRATMAVYNFPNLEGKWHWVGPFESDQQQSGLDNVYPPEKLVDLNKPVAGRDGKDLKWAEAKLELGKVFDIYSLSKKTLGHNQVVYLYHEFESKQSDSFVLPVSLGSDDSIKIFFNGKEVLRDEATRPAAPDQNLVELLIKPGKNQLLVKVVNLAGGFEVYLNPEFPRSFPETVKKQLDRNFPKLNSAVASASTAEATHYRIITLDQPKDCVLEVGGLNFRPDGKLVACTRRGEVWLITNPDSENPEKVQWQRFASGLHETLGVTVEDNNTLVLAQRPELTRLIDRDGDGKADEFVTLCDKWGCSGDYHEYAFGPAKDKDGNYYITLNVGFGGGHQSKSPWRGWCVKVSPNGDFEPFAYGLRSPNGVNFSPEGELFYSDNQGEWVASNKLHHIRKGRFYGHQASLVWLKRSPFADKSDKVPFGMMYDGQKDPKSGNGPEGFPEVDPPVIWFPYGRMGQSVSEPRWDTSAGKFGPFAGQMFVGDQTKSIVMRVAMEKIGDRYQGACFPFRAGFQCGVNRLCFGPDGSLYVGQTARGWGSVGPKQYGLQRLVYTGILPFEIATMNLTKDGFDLAFTKPINSKTAEKLTNYSLKSFTYVYSSNYGYPETDTRSEKVTSAVVSSDRMKVSISVPNLKPGRVYDLHLEALLSEDGDSLLHSDAYYTLNQLIK